MQALKRWARETLAFVSLDRPDWDEWWEEFKRFNPVSAQITEEFWKRYRKKLRRLSIHQAVAGYGKTELKFYENYYGKRVYELRKNPEHTSLFQNQSIQMDGQYEDESKGITQ